MKTQETPAPLLIDFKTRFIASFIVLLGLINPSLKLCAQDFNALEISETIVDFYTKKKLEGVSVVILEKRDDGTWEEYARTTTDRKAFMSSQLYLQKEYLVVFTKDGYLKKKILIDTEMSGKDEDFYEHDNVLYMTSKVISDEDSAALLDKPVVRVYFDDRLKGFAFDSLYTANIKKEVKSIPPDLKEKLVKRIESNTKTTGMDPAAITKAENDYMKLLREVDSERRRRENEAKEREQFVLDSIANAKILAKQRADSLAREVFLAKQREDSIAYALEAQRIRDSIAQTYAKINPTNNNPVLTPTLTPNVEPEKELSFKEIIAVQVGDAFYGEMSAIASEGNATRKIQIEIEREKMDNMHNKYKSGSPFISLLDEIDMYQKQQTLK